MHGLAIGADLIDQVIAQFGEHLHDRPARLARDDRCVPGSRSRDEPDGVCLVRAHDRREKIHGVGLVVGRDDALGKVDISDRPIEASCGRGDVAVVLSCDESADTLRDLMRDVAIIQVERHVFRVSRL